MKRFHIHVAVADREQSIQFYSTFFNATPSVMKTDYAKWMLDDPRINFAISVRGREPGLNHLGIQVEDAGDLNKISLRLKTAGEPVLEQEQTTCCYAKSDKTWVHDPQGIAWEPSTQPAIQQPMVMMWNYQSPPNQFAVRRQSILRKRNLAAPLRRSP